VSFQGKPVNVIVVKMGVNPDAGNPAAANRDGVSG
jgi:hypothetical protein